jgi:hypothetical protein
MKHDENFSFRLVFCLAFTALFLAIEVAIYKTFSMPELFLWILLTHVNFRFFWESTRNSDLRDELNKLAPRPAPTQEGSPKE